MFLRRSELFPTILVLLATALLLTLGTWQVQRLLWKNNLITTIEQRMHLSSLEIGDCTSLSAASSEDFYRPAHLTGHFLYDHSYFLYAGPREAQGVQGYRIFTLFACSKGGHVLVDRGWVPLDYRQMQEKIYRPEGELVLHGTLLGGEKPGWFTPTNNPERNLWYWIDLPAMSAASHTSLPPVFFMQAPAPTTGPIHTRYPMGKEVSPQIRNDHLQYAITWYSLAVIAWIIFILVLRQKRAES